MHWTQAIVQANQRYFAVRARARNHSPAGRGDSWGLNRDRILRAATREYRTTLKAHGLELRQRAW